MFMLLWLGFIACTAVIVYSGTKLSKFGDIIAEKTGLGRTWVGVVLMAGVTSLPELVTGISAVTYAGVPDIAVGDVLGSCVFNLLILAFLDALHRPAPISSRAHQGQILSASLGALLLSVVAMSLFLSPYIYPIGWIGPYSLINALLYFLAIRIVYFYEKKRIADFVKEIAAGLRYKDISAKTAAYSYTASALLVVVAASFLPKIGEGIAETTGLGQTFVGNIFIAVSTSLPEIVVSIAAVKMGAVDMAIGNLFGSNIFNIFILALDDFFFVKGPILSHVNPSHIVPALSAVSMTAIAIAGITYRSERKRLFMSWDSIAIAIVYFANMLVLYTIR